MTTPPPPGYLGPNPDPRGPQPLQQFPPQGPPPGFAGGPPPPMPRQSAQQRPVAALAALSLISIVAVVVGLTVKEDGRNAWDTVHAWGGLAVLGAVLTLAPAVGRALGLSPHRAAQVAACGAGALVLFWVLFTLPVVGTNTSLVTTIGVAAGVVVAWLASERDERGVERPASW